MCVSFCVICIPTLYSVQVIMNMQLFGIFDKKQETFVCIYIRTKMDSHLCVCVSASDAHDWSAHSPARRSPPGTDGWIHDSFCNEEKKKGESAFERRNSQDHWEIIRWSGVVDLELNGIINQAKKQARCSYIYYLHVFHFRRCNQQIYVGAPDPCHGDLEAERPFLPLTLKA